jgi:hypothetical protein
MPRVKISPENILRFQPSDGVFVVSEPISTDRLWNFLERAW